MSWCSNFREIVTVMKNSFYSINFCFEYADESVTKMKIEISSKLINETVYCHMMFWENRRFKDQITLTSLYNSIITTASVFDREICCSNLWHLLLHVVSSNSIKQSNHSMKSRRKATREGSDFKLMSCQMREVN